MEWVAAADARRFVVELVLEKISTLAENIFRHADDSGIFREFLERRREIDERLDHAQASTAPIQVFLDLEARLAPLDWADDLLQLIECLPEALDLLLLEQPCYERVAFIVILADLFVG